jgi:diacylglycerol O-acyltransferase / wax synthase
MTVDRLNPMDAVFLDAEDADPHVSMAIGSIAVFAGPPPSQAEYVAALSSRMSAVRRAQQRVRRVPFDVGPPVWVDLGQFDAGYHIRVPVRADRAAAADRCRRAQLPRSAVLRRHRRLRQHP